MSDVSSVRDRLVGLLTGETDLDADNVSAIDGEPDVLGLEVDGELYFLKVIPA